jgi:two-component system heavy metal sensor histidine kinase CusS
VLKARTRISIGAKLTLRYTAAVSVTLTAVAFFVYAQVVQRINREARLLIEVQARELAQQLADDRRGARFEDRRAALSDHMERVVRSTDPDLGLTLEIVALDGAPLLRAGPERPGAPPVSRAVLDGRIDQLLRALNGGTPNALLALDVRVPVGAVRVMIDTVRYANNVQHVRDVFLLSFPVVLVLTAALGWLLARTSLRPISDLLGAARQISHATLDERLPESGSGDELDLLAGTLNDMLVRVRQSIVQMRRFNANAAHQLRTPLTVISSQIEVTLAKEREPVEYRRAMADILARIGEISDGVAAMLHLSQIEAGLPVEHCAPVAIRPVVETVVEFFSPVADEKGVALAVGALPSARVAGHAQWLHELFSNLLANAITHTPRGCGIEVSGYLDGPRVALEVVDTGAGIPLEQHERIFERFERGNSTSHGFGLGLPIAREIARAHGGEIAVVPSPGPGTRMRVVLPRLLGDEVPGERVPPDPAAAGARAARAPDPELALRRAR